MKGETAVSAVVGSLDRDALSAVFEEHAPAIYRYLLRLGVFPLEADQLVGDVFARLLEKLAEGKGPRKNLRSYLFQTAYHLVVDYARHRQRTAPLDVADTIKEEKQPVQAQTEEKMLLEKLATAMERVLTEDQRNVLVLRFQEDFSLQETADIIGKNVNAIKAVQSRAILKLREALSNETGWNDGTWNPT